MWMLEQARAAGVELVNGRVETVEMAAGRVGGVTFKDGTRIGTEIFVNAAGPRLAEMGAMLGVEIPVVHELHLKAAFNDNLGALGRDAPLVICADEQQLEWSAEERESLAEEPETAWLTTTLPFGAHTRPEGDLKAESILVLWDVHNEPVEARFPIETDPMAAELALRGLAQILPGMQGYVERMPRPFVDGGYYTKTRENRPLVGALTVEGAYMIGAGSGYGIMAAAGMGELLAAQIVGGELPGYARALGLERYEDPGYMKMLDAWGESWQL
jgi:glycine/D-amino acid oxidase-like deaminating enzyme